MSLPRVYKENSGWRIMSDIQLFNEDCLVGMRRIPDCSIDCVLCDLPYGTTNCHWDIVLPFDELWQQYTRVCKPNAPIILFATEPFTSMLICSNIKHYKEKLIWEKHRPSNFANAKKRHLNYCEDIVVFSRLPFKYNPQMQPRESDRVRQAQKGKSKQWCNPSNVSFATKYAPRDWSCFDADLKYPSNVLKFPSVVSNSHEKTIHPTQKPVALLSYLIRTYTDIGDIVLDNCFGSGSTAVACIREKRNFIGFEKETSFFSIAVQRCNEIRESIQPELFEDYGTD